MQYLNNDKGIKHVLKLHVVMIYCILPKKVEFP